MMDLEAAPRGEDIEVTAEPSGPSQEELETLRKELADAHAKVQQLEELSALLKESRRGFDTETNSKINALTAEKTKLEGYLRTAKTVLVSL